MSATRISCHINASRAAVYRALLDARAVAKWKVPDGMTCHVHTIDAREGGSFRISLTYDALTGTGKTTAHTDTYHGRFVKLVPNEQIVELDEFETRDPTLCGDEWRCGSHRILRVAPVTRGERREYRRVAVAVCGGRVEQLGRRGAVVGCVDRLRRLVRTQARSTVLAVCRGRLALGTPMLGAGVRHGRGARGLAGRFRAARARRNRVVHVRAELAVPCGYGAHRQAQRSRGLRVPRRSREPLFAATLPVSNHPRAAERECRSCRRLAGPRACTSRTYTRSW